MTFTPWIPRTRILPARGRALISADLHGSLVDFEPLADRFERLRRAGEEVHWLLLGDLVHGPSDAARRRSPALYDYEDASPALVEAVLELRRRHPDRIHVLLGNHDHGHVGGPPTAKFYADEVAALEGRCTPAQRAAIRELFADALLAAVAPAGLLFAHACPDDQLVRFADLDDVRLEVGDNDAYHRHLLATFTRSYGQPAAVTGRLLAAVSASAAPVRVLVHGHERDPAGWYSEHEGQLSPVIFGAPREARRYLEIDLGAAYSGASALRDGVEIRRIHGDAADPRPSPSDPPGSG